MQNNTNEVRIIGIYNQDETTNQSALNCPDETRTHQEFAEESDINTIIERFGIGENPITAQKWIENIDIADAPDNYQDVLNQLNEARDQFMSLPARVRTRFNNSAHEFVNFVSDQNNLEEMVQMGLATKREEPKIEPKTAPEQSSS